MYFKMPSFKNWHVSLSAEGQLVSPIWVSELDHDNPHNLIMARCIVWQQAIIYTCANADL